MSKGRPFAVFDIDGTLIRWQLYHAVSERLAKGGHFSPETRQAISEARMAWKRREHEESFKAYERKLVQAHDDMIKLLPVKEFERAAEEAFAEYKDQTYTYTRDLIRKLKADGYLLFAISGSQSGIVSKIANYYGFDDFRGTDYMIKNGHYTGEFVYAAQDKSLVLAEMVVQHKAVWKDSIAVGDGKGDIAMLEKVEQPIAFNPEKKLFVHAKKCGWKIVLERKNMIYELEPSDGRYILA